MCLLPFWGFAASGGQKKGEMKFSLLYRSQWGIFAFWWFLSDISATRALNATDPHQISVCRRAPSPLASIDPWGRVEGELKIQNMAHGGGVT